jgi:hypothetical protein
MTMLAQINFPAKFVSLSLYPPPTLSNAHGEKVSDVKKGKSSTLYCIVKKPVL